MVYEEKNVYNFRNEFAKEWISYVSKVQFRSANGNTFQ